VDEALKFLQVEAGQEGPVSLWLVLFALLLTTMCSIVIGAVYRRTHRSAGYSPTYVQTLVLTSVVTAVIMVVIGSNLARAFSLVGALSVIRFRNAIKETRDVGYIFFAMAVAMAAGTRFFGIAILATAYICALMMVLHHFGYGDSKQEPERLLRVRLPYGTDPGETLEKVFQELFLSYQLVVAESARQGMFLDTIYSVRKRPEVTPSEMIEKIGKVNGNLKVSYHLDLHSEEV